MVKNVLFVKPWESTFIERDRKIIEKHYNIRIHKTGYGQSNLRDRIMAIISVVKGIFWADIVFIWFAGFHPAHLIVALSKIFCKKVIVVVGGGEVAKVSDIQYGGAISAREKKSVAFVLKNSSRIIAVSEFSREEIIEMEQRVHPIIIHNAIETDQYTLGDESKEKIVITVAIINEKTILRKGLVTFVKTASRFPEVKFVVIGGCEDESIDHLINIAPNNVEFTGFVDNQQLRLWYQRAKVYCQLSIHEGFGVALVESMSCGCIPVVTSNGALPEVVGNVGFFAQYGDVDSTEEAIRKALDSNDQKDVRNRVVELFDIKIREEKIVHLIDDLSKEMM